MTGLTASVRPKGHQEAREAADLACAVAFKCIGQAEILCWTCRKVNWCITFSDMCNPREVRFEKPVEEEIAKKPHWSQVFLNKGDFSDRTSLLLRPWMLQTGGFLPDRYTRDSWRLWWTGGCRWEHQCVPRLADIYVLTCIHASVFGLAVGLPRVDVV